MIWIPVLGLLAVGLIAAGWYLDGLRPRRRSRDELLRLLLREELDRWEQERQRLKRIRRAA